MATTTVTHKRLKRALRGAISPKFNESLPLDLKNFNLELVQIERFYPDFNEVRILYRDTLIDDGNEPVKRNVGLCQPYPIHPDITINVTPPGTEEICSETKRRSIVPDITLVGAVMSIKGDPNGNGVLLIAFPAMAEDEGIMSLEPSINLTFKDSTIVIKEGEICINAPVVKINGNTL